MKSVLSFFKKIIKYFERYQAIFVIIAVIVASVLPQLINIFHYPYFSNDEGTYMSEAWAVFTHARLSPYTYWYDHSPAGWILVAIWVKLTGGFFRFGPALFSGRVFMLVLHVLSALLLYFIAKKLSGSRLAALLAVAFFSFSPLGIYYQRRLLLDNIMVFWFLLSFYFLIKNNLKLRDAFLGGIFFGIAALSKENAIFIFPAFVYGLYLYFPKETRKFAMCIWSVASLGVVSFYLLFAIIKNELLPSPDGQHVSLIGTLQFQASRGTHLPFWNPASDLYVNFIDWFYRDHTLICLGIFFLLLNVVLMIYYKNLRVIVLSTLLLILFFIRGGLVLNFYVIPLIPMFALNIVVGASCVLDLNRCPRVLLWLLYIWAIALFSAYTFNSYPFKALYSTDSTTSQIEGIQWVKDNVPANSEIIVDDYAYVDLHGSYYNSKIFPNADIYSKVQEDPAIKDEKLHDDWNNVDYVMMTYDVASDLKTGDVGILGNAVAHATVVKTFSNILLPEAFYTYKNLQLYPEDEVVIFKVNKDPDQGASEIDVGTSSVTRRDY